jgi:hypothetical protein
MPSRGPYRRHSAQFKLQFCSDIRSGKIGRRETQKTYAISANLIQMRLTQSDSENLSIISGPTGAPSDGGAK